MKNPNLKLLEAAVRLLEPLRDDLVLVGGCATGLLITDPAAEGVRPTTDVDAVIEVASYGEYVTLSERLRAVTLREDRSRSVNGYFGHRESRAALSCTGLPGAIATAEGLEACRDQLAEVEEWILIRISRGLAVPRLGTARVQVRRAS